MIAPPAGRLIVLADVTTATERALISDWARRTHPAARVVDIGSPDLGRHIAEPGDLQVLPIRVAWLPRERDGDRRVRVSDLLALRNPRRPRPALQRRIARREPDRIHVVVGEPATVADLRRRCHDETAGAEALDSYVRRMAALACDRAERQIIGDRYKVPRLVAEQILSSARFRGALQRLAAETGRPIGQLLTEAQECLEEVATVQSPVAIDVFRALVRPMHARAWDVKVDADELRRLKELNRRHALVFLPSHRSYVDPLVLADVFHNHDLPRTHIIGGDNMGFWPFGSIGKRAGVVFIRRDFGSDAVYKLAVREFLGHLVSKRFNLEWYLEGGRSRTGKLRPPKYGLLRYIADAVEAGQADDVMLVPVSIAYDRQAEVTDITAQQTGAAKRREGLAWMLDYIRAQRHKAGPARVNFGEPLSLRAALAEAGDGPARLEKVAFRVCDGINKVTPVTPSSIVTLSLLGLRDRAVTVDQIVRVTAPLLDYCERRGLPGPVGELRCPQALRSALDSLVDAGAASVFNGGREPVWWIPPGAHHAAAFYRNGALHHLVNRAIIELALLHLARRGEVDSPLDAAWREALALRDLLKFEFFFADKRTFRSELAQELALLDPAWERRVVSADAAAELLRSSGMLLAHRALRSFFDAQWIVATELAEQGMPTDREAFVGRCVGIGRQHVLQGTVHGEESVSRDLFSSALDLADNRGGLEVSEIQDVIERLRLIARLDAEAIEGVLAR